MKHVITVFAFFLLLLTTGCSNNISPGKKGGEDFPNSVILLGKVISDNLNSYSEWNQLEDIQDTLPDIFYAETLHTLYSDTNASSRIVKRGNSKDTVIWNLQDTAQGIAVVYYFKDAFFFLISDTITVLYNDSARDSVFGNEIVLKKLGRTSARFSKEWLDYCFMDSDTNSFFDSMNISHSKTGILGTIIASARATSGNDNNFTKGKKIKFSFLQSLMISSQDTVWLHEIEEADSSGNIFDSSLDANSVDYKGIIKNPILRPSISRIEKRLRARIISSNRRKIIVNKYVSLLDYKDGSQRNISIFGNNADSSFNTEDTAFIKLEKKENDNISTILTFTVLLGQNVYDCPVIPCFGLELRNQHRQTQYRLLILNLNLILLLLFLHTRLTAVLS